MEFISGGVNPEDRTAAAHSTAWLVAHGPEFGDGEAFTPEQARRLHELLDEDGLELLASLWSDCPAASLPGALWRLYAVAAWVQTNPHQAATEYAAGRQAAPVSDAIAGVADPPSPEAVQTMIDAVLSGMGGGDVGLILDRVSAFLRIIAAGRVADAEPMAPAAGPTTTATSGAQPLTNIAALIDTAGELYQAARRWHAGTLT